MRNIVIFLLVFFISFNIVQADNDCPFGIENDPAPGQCGLFVDRNNDTICDHSKVQESAKHKIHNTRAENSYLDGKLEYYGDNNVNNLSDISVASNQYKYKFMLILVSLITLYIISLLMVKSKYISLFVHHRIWNVLLLFTFLATAIMGVMLIFAINFEWFLSWYAFLLYWHVEIGSAMVIITIFHLSWHWQYYVAIFKKKPKLENINNK